MSDEDCRATIAELQAQFKELDQEGYDADPMMAQDRGREFEKLVRGIFRAWGMLRRGAFHTGDNKSEQIDGVIEFDVRYALLEAKWEKANLAASELFAFLGKVEGKFIGTIGVFVSRNELTSNFLTALRAGRRQCIMVIHGRDVDHLFDPDFDLPRYLTAHLMNICMDNTCHLSADKHLAKLKAAEAKKSAATTPKGDPVEAALKECLKDQSSENVVHELAEDLTAGQRVDAVERVLNNYADLVAQDGDSDESWRSQNLKLFLKELAERLPKRRTDADALFFLEKLSKEFQNPDYGPLTDTFAQRYQYLEAGEQKRFEERLVRQWDKIIGEWTSENRMAVTTRPLWTYLGAGTREHLIEHFVEFILSDRRSHFEQHQLADYALEQQSSLPAAKKALRRRASRAAANWFEDEDYTDEEGVKRVIKYVTKAMQHMEQYIPDFKQQVKTAVRKALDERETKK